MTIQVSLLGDNKALKVSEDNSLPVSMSPNPPTNIELKSVPFSEFLSLDGNGVVESLLVDGSSEPKEFFVTGVPGFDRYITEFHIILSDNSVVLSGFGGGATLTNGIDFFYASSQRNAELISNITNNFNLCRYCGGGVDNFTIYRNVIGIQDALLPVLRWSQRMPPYGPRLQAGTRQRLGIRVNDNLTSIANEFNVLVTGIEVSV